MFNVDISNQNPTVSSFFPTRLTARLSAQINKKI